VALIVVDSRGERQDVASLERRKSATESAAYVKQLRRDRAIWDLTSRLGYSKHEIADAIGCTVRAIEYRLAAMREAREALKSLAE
jgi:DNA-directed RNA polymerase specialized sigma24 family protein